MQYVDLLTVAVFEVIKNGDPQQFEADFRNAFFKAASKEHLSKGQKRSFYSTVKPLVKRCVSCYRARCPQLPLEIVTVTKPVSGPPPAPMPESYRKWYQEYKARQTTK